MSGSASVIMNAACPLMIYVYSTYFLLSVFFFFFFFFYLVFYKLKGWAAGRWPPPVLVLVYSYSSSYPYWDDSGKVSLRETPRDRR